MLADLYYLVRSQQNGQYLVARPHIEKEKTGFLLLFSEHAQALSYLNTHGGEIANRFGVETVTKPQLRTILDRLGFQGVGLVEDPLLPTIQFLVYE